ncbi:S-layer homology domain-containing protein [Paenibacillus sp. GP183]|uniref:S-layer homology domain-containing protein n=1 Tax=Paenibacillus sp. GP183 TaxID=1882751 RepID=UPI00089D3272|nr:S-layer homology domain-containing protein [Paenibacillus sp. GP183]SEC31603.1 S-layer homology domain-containing protein [Paenibacillus sp. GP183]
MNKISLALTSVLLSSTLLAGCTANGIKTKSLNDNRGYRPFATTAPGMPTQFTDVPYDWYTDKVQWGANLGIIDGYPDLTFHPNSPITRAEVIKIIKSLSDKGYITVPATPTPTTSPAPSPSL